MQREGGAKDLMRGVSVPGALPSIIAGWHFLTVEASPDEDAIWMRAAINEDGPSIVYNPERCPPSMFENPVSALLWLPMCLSHITQSLLLISTQSDDGIGPLISVRWNEFRRHAARAMGMTWEEILRAARLDGIDRTAEYMTSAIFVEDGIQGALARRAIGAPTLHLI